MTLFYLHSQPNPTMGMLMSLMGRGVPSTQMLSLVTGKLYREFLAKDIRSLEDFHVAILDIFNTFNSALPGKHFDVPQCQELQDLYRRMKNERVEAMRRNMFVDFMMAKIIPSKLDHSTILAGVIAPPAAMALKRAGENVPQVGVIKRIPDVVFVPTATIFTLVSVKITRRLLFARISS